MLDINKLISDIGAENAVAHDIMIAGIQNDGMIPSSGLQLQYLIYDRLGDLITMIARTQT